jgi:hypothetical protein
MATTFGSKESEAAHEDTPRLFSGLAIRSLLATLSLAAGAVHLAMAPIHAGESTTEAIGFAVVGWAQILLAIGLFLKPSKPVLQGTLLLNAAVIVGYIVSRTAGLPVGEEFWQAESAGSIDVMTTVFEAILVAGAAILLLRPTLAARLTTESEFSFEALAIAAALPGVVLVATSMALTDPDLTQHGHDEAASVSSTGGGGHGHGGGVAPTDGQMAALAENRCDLDVNPAAYWKETTLSGVDTLMGGEAAMSDHNAGASVQGSSDLDRIVAQQMTSEGEGGDAAMVVALSETTDDVYENWLRWLAASGLTNHSHGGNEFAPDDNKGMGGHLGPQAWHAMTDQAQCDQLKSELKLARETALKYPTVADAEAAGWVQVTPYVPGIAAHFMKFSVVDGTFDITQPEMILYDGTDDNARVIGLSYFIRQAGAAEPTQGFTGNNDHYHRHDGLCIGATGVIGDSTTTEEECRAMGGRKANGSSGWMSHAWVVPGCESPWGVFSGANPILDRELTANSGEDGGGCGGSGVLARYDLAPGNEGNTPTSVGGTVELVSSN